MPGAVAAMTVNGVDATTGSYLLPPMPMDEVARLASDGGPTRRELAELRARRHRDTQQFLGVREGVDPVDLSSAGWGVVFAADCDPSVREALGPLLDHRRGQAAATSERRYREFTGPDGLLRDESKGAFLARHGVGPGPADPDRMPYYLLLVGPPDAMPFSVQHLLDVQYAVGRLHFDDVDGYARYAEAVVSAEANPPRDPVSARGAFFGPRHADDQATALSVDDLVAPLAAQLPLDLPDWSFRTEAGEDASAATLAAMLHGDERPDLLVTATHGLGFPVADPRQRAEQGALVCQDWPGPSAGVPIARDQYFARDDLDSSRSLSGLVAFHLACFGAGTPQVDGFAPRTAAPAMLTTTPFVAGLVQAMLAHPGGPALAVVGHVDRAWGYSFSWPGAGSQTEVVRSLLRRICTGQPVGHAMEYVNQRYAELASEVSELVDEAHQGRRVDDAALAALWVARNDMRGYALLGDPAVHLRVRAPTAHVSPGAAVARP
jgi:hypothetical protein